jgi:hypothetical protein
METLTAGWNRLCSVPNYEPRKEIPDYGKGIIVVARCECGDEC